MRAALSRLVNKLILLRDIWDVFAYDQGYLGVIGDPERKYCYGKVGYCIQAKVIQEDCRKTGKTVRKEGVKESNGVRRMRTYQTYVRSGTGQEQGRDSRERADRER